MPSQSGPGSNSNKGEHHILQSSKTEASLLDSLVSYLGHSLSLTSQERCCWCIVQLQRTTLKSEVNMFFVFLRKLIRIFIFRI